LFFAVAAIFLFLLFSRFDLDWKGTWSTIRGINIWLYMAAIGTYYASFWFRGMRWQLLARNTGALTQEGSRVPSVPKASQLILIGWFVNSIMWLRLGDAYRAYLFAQHSKSSFSWSLGTIVAERIVDIATMLVILVASIAAFTLTKQSTAANLLLVAAVAIVAVSATLLLAMRFYGQRLAQLLPKRMEAAYNNFQQGTLGSIKQIPGVFTLGLIGWALEVGRLYFVVAALGLDAPFALLPIVALGHALLSTVPTPGGVGVVEPGLVGLLLISMDRSDAISITLVDRTITYLSIIGVGGLIFLILHMTKSERDSQKLTPFS
jgi:uncharacterized protein (TIRG00374 family)